MNWMIGIVGVGVAALVGCGAEAVCTPGLQQSCACPGEEIGAQACNAEGTGFEECICAPGASGGGGSGGVNGGGGAPSSLSECVAACEEAMQCEGADPSTDCEANCTQGKADSASFGCSVEYENLIACVITVDDVCNPGEQCSTQASAYGDCIVEACTDNPGLPACN